MMGVMGRNDIEEWIRSLSLGDYILLEGLSHLMSKLRAIWVHILGFYPDRQYEMHTTVFFLKSIFSIAQSLTVHTL